MDLAGVRGACDTCVFIFVCEIIVFIISTGTGQHVRRVAKVPDSCPTRRTRSPRYNCTPRAHIFFSFRFINSSTKVVLLSVMPAAAAAHLRHGVGRGQNVTRPAELPELARGGCGGFLHQVHVRSLAVHHDGHGARHDVLHVRVPLIQGVAVGVDLDAGDDGEVALGRVHGRAHQFFHVLADYLVRQFRDLHQIQPPSGKIVGLHRA
mmetsp:Transcript_10866/g.40233  ORF Transcript_10866/g.40233 Transcript_10866/m.40233 type:complete len:207 (-) Transcript_10866:817-1437(-)